MTRRIAAALLAVVVTACGTAPSGPPGSTDLGGPGGPATSAGPQPSTHPLRAGDFSEATVDLAVALLADSGIATFQEPGAAVPVREVAAPASPVRLLLDQVRSMALEAHAGGGLEGAELDALFDVPSDLAPPSYVLAGYVAAVDTPGARLSRELMGVEDWTPEDWRSVAPTIVFPRIVLALFTSDVTREREAASTAASPASGLAAVALDGQIAAAGPGLPAGFGRVGQAAAGPCSAVLDFVSGALKSVFDGLRLGDSSSTVGTIVTTIWNFVVTVLETVINGLVKNFEQYVLDWIGRVAAIVGTVATVISWVQPWTATVRPDPVSREKGLTGILSAQDGQLIARVAVPADWNWPQWASDCAQQSGRSLPNMKPEGTPVAWEALIQNPPALVAPGTAETKLDAQGAARLQFTTLVDDVVEPYLTYPGAIYVRVTFQRQSLKEFATYLQGELWKELPSIVVGPLQAFLQPSLDKINQRLGTMITVSASGPAVVRFHVQDATPPPPTATPKPSDEGEFCRRYRDYVNWATALGPDTDMTQELAAEIATRFDNMWPVAPSEMKQWVALVWAVYSTFAGIAEPVNIPATGQVAGIEKLPDALMAMHAYCGIPWPAA